MLRLSGLLLSAILCFFLTSCATTPPNVPVCEHFAQRLWEDPQTGHTLLSPSPTCMEKIGEPECGHCVWIVEGQEAFLGEKEGHLLNGKPWSQIRKESVYLPAKESYAPLATYVINSCKKLRCNDDLTKFKVKLDSLKAVK
jgi:hypothetical protein